MSRRSSIGSCCSTRRRLLVLRDTSLQEWYFVFLLVPNIKANYSIGACCSKVTGYCNYGPEACGTNGQSPNDVCWSNCDAKAACGRYADPPGKTCPLNVCCSEWGFCGIDSGQEFCSSKCQSNCAQPGSGGSGGNVQNRIIGYYEAWNVESKCAGMVK